MAQNSYDQIFLAGNLTLTWPSAFETSTTSISDINNVIPNSGGLRIILPSALSSTRGQNVKFQNSGVHSYSLYANDNATLVATIAPGEMWYIQLDNTQTAEGIWTAVPDGGGVSNVTSVAATSANAALSITGSPITSAGTLNFAVSQSLNNLNGLSTSGIPVVLSTSPLTWTTREIVAGSNIVVTNPTGIAGNMIVGLSSTLTGMTSITIGDLGLSNDLIRSISGNNDLNINTGGTGKVKLNGVSIDSSGNLTGVNNLVLPNTFFVFTDTMTGGSNVIVITTDINVATLVRSGTGTYAVTFTTAQPSINYAIFLTPFTGGGVTPVILHARPIDSSRTVNGFSFQVVNASGQLVLEAPNGISGMVIAAS